MQLPLSKFDFFDVALHVNLKESFEVIAFTVELEGPVFLGLISDTTKLVKASISDGPSSRIGDGEDSLFPSGVEMKALAKCERSTSFCRGLIGTFGESEELDCQRVTTVGLSLVEYFFFDTCGGLLTYT